MTIYDESPPSPPPLPSTAGPLEQVESHGIDYVPHAERFGKPWHLAPVWLMGCAHLVSFTVGFIGPSIGLNLTWSLIGIVLGACFGIFFSAFHSTQGPQLGLPQMIQSRAQFGYQGAVLILVVVFLGYIGQAIVVSLLSRDALSATLDTPADPTMVVAVLAGLAVATVGYNFIHRVARWMSFMFIVVYGILTVAMFFTLDIPAGNWTFDGFAWTPFLIQFGATAGYLIAWAPYVSDYSRYLPADVKVSSVFAWTGVGMLIGGIWVIVIGAVLASAFPAQVAAFDLIGVVQAGGDSVFDGFGTVVALAGIPGLLYLLGMSLYGGTLTLLSTVDSFTETKLAQRARVSVTLGLGVVVYIAAFLAPGSAVENANALLAFLLYTLVPWTAVNLVDFFVVRRGHYSVREIFNPNGIYGRWGWRGMTAYIAGFVAMIPFFSNSKWVGPIAEKLGGADISAFIGLPVAAVVYLVLVRSLDLPAERRQIKIADAGLEPAETA